MKINHLFIVFIHACSFLISCLNNGKKYSLLLVAYKYKYNMKLMDSPLKCMGYS